MHRELGGDLVAARAVRRLEGGAEPLVEPAPGVTRQRLVHGAAVQLVAEGIAQCRAAVGPLAAAHEAEEPSGARQRFAGRLHVRQVAAQGRSNGLRDELATRDARRREQVAVGRCEAGERRLDHVVDVVGHPELDGVEAADERPARARSRG